MLDVKIIGGDIMDGTGSRRFRADIGIAEGRIVAIGEVEEPTRETIGAAGCVVAPALPTCTPITMSRRSGSRSKAPRASMASRP